MSQQQHIHAFYSLRQELQLLHDIHGIAKCAEHQCHRDFITATDGQFDSKTVQFKADLDLCMFEIRARLLNRIAAVKRQIELCVMDMDLDDWIFPY